MKYSTIRDIFQVSFFQSMLCLLQKCLTNGRSEIYLPEATGGPLMLSRSYIPMVIDFEKNEGFYWTTLALIKSRLSSSGGQPIPNHWVRRGRLGCVEIPD